MSLGAWLSLNIALPPNDVTHSFSLYSPASLTGLHSVSYAFPRVHIITSAVDRQLSDRFHILPGIGNFGNRYFGTEPSSTVPSPSSSQYNLSK